MSSSQTLATVFAVQCTGQMALNSQLWLHVKVTATSDSWSWKVWLAEIFYPFILRLCLIAIYMQNVLLTVVCVVKGHNWNVLSLDKTFNIRFSQTLLKQDHLVFVWLLSQLTTTHSYLEPVLMSLNFIYNWIFIRELTDFGETEGYPIFYDSEENQLCFFLLLKIRLLSRLNLNSNSKTLILKDSSVLGPFGPL